MPAQPHAFTRSAANGTVMLFLLLLLQRHRQYCPGSCGHVKQRGSCLGVQQARWVLQQVAVAPRSEGRTLRRPSSSPWNSLHDALDGERGAPASGPRSRALVSLPRLGTQCGLQRRDGEGGGRARAFGFSRSIAIGGGREQQVAQGMRMQRRARAAPGRGGWMSCEVRLWRGGGVEQEAGLGDVQGGGHSGWRERAVRVASRR